MGYNCHEDFPNIHGLKPRAELIMPMALPMKLQDLYKASLIKYVGLSDEFGRYYNTDGITTDHCAGLVITLGLEVFPVYQGEITTLRGVRIGQDANQKQILIQSPTSYAQVKFDFTKGSMESSILAFNDARCDRFLIMYGAQFKGPSA